MMIGDVGQITLPIILDDLLVILQRYRRANPDSMLQVRANKRTLAVTRTSFPATPSGAVRSTAVIGADDRDRPSTGHVAAVVTDDDAPAPTRSADDPDGVIIIHHRATDTLYFGPFATVDDALDFCNENPLVLGAIVPCYRTVDWNR